MKVIKLGMAVIALAGGLSVQAAADLKEDVARLAVRVLAEKFGVDPRVADRYLARPDRDVFDAAPCFSTSYYTRRPVDDVWDLRQQGLGWGQIAHRLGMHPGQFNKLRKSGAFDRDRIWGSILKERYGARESDLISIKKKGGSMRDALHVFVIAHECGDRPETVFRRYQKERDWERTATAFKVNLRDHAAAGHRDDRQESGRPANDFQEDGKSTGRGNARREAGVDGEGQAETGNGHGNGKGHGKGRGRGKGPG